MINQLKELVSAWHVLGWCSALVLAGSAHGVTKRNAMILQGQGGMAVFSVFAGSTPINTSVFRGGGNYFLSSKVSLNGSYYSATNLATAQTLLSGFDIGSRLYLFSPGASQTIQSKNLKIEVSSAINHYLSLQYVQRELSLPTTQVNYSGFSMGYGLAASLGHYLDIPFLKPYYVNLEVNYETLSAPQRANGSTMNYLGGLEVSL